MGYDNNTDHPGRYIPCWEKIPVVEITLIQMMAEEHKVSTSMVIQVIQNEVSVQPNF